MPVRPEMKIDKRFKNRISGRYGKYSFGTGVDNKVHYAPRRPVAYGTLQGGPVRKKGLKTYGSTMLDVAKAMQKKTGFMTAPFRKQRSRDMQAFLKAFFAYASGKASKSKVQTALRAVVRNPMLRGDYGRNTRMTAKMKGFNRLLFDTGQLFKSILSYVRTRNVQR